jgi:hypothetical protein
MGLQRVNASSSSVAAASKHCRAVLAGLAGAVPVARPRRQFNQDRIGVALVDDVYVFSGPDRVVNPVQSVAARVAATEGALAAGYTGLRAVVDATTLAGTSAQRAAYAHYEYLLDQQSSTLSLGTICAYDTATLGGAAVAEMACLHPFTSRGASTFRLYAHDGAAFALAGEVDCSSVVQFADTLGRVLPLVLPLVPGPELVVDGRELEFIDHRGLLVLDRCAGQLGLRLAMQTHRQTAAHIAEALGLQHLRVECWRESPGTAVPGRPPNPKPPLTGWTWRALPRRCRSWPVTSPRAADIPSRLSG